MKNKVILCALFSVLCSLLLTCGGKGKTVVTVNGKAITEGDLDLLGTINPQIKMQLATPFGKKQILDNVVEQELMYQASLKRGLQNDSKVKAKIELYKKVIISQGLLNDEMEKSTKEYYDQHKDEFEKLQFSHILVKFAQPTEGKADKKKAQKLKGEAEALKLANAAKARLDKGEDFAKVAKEVSEDTFTKGNGGDLGKASKNESRLDRRGLSPLLEKAFTMKVGEIAGPIKTKEGYHIITVTKGLELEAFDNVKQGITFKIQGDLRNKLLADLKKDAKIVYAEDEKKKEEKKAEESKPEAPPTTGGAQEGGEAAQQPQPQQLSQPAPQAEQQKK